MLCFWLIPWPREKVIEASSSWNDHSKVLRWRKLSTHDQIIIIVSRSRAYYQIHFLRWWGNTIRSFLIKTNKNPSISSASLHYCQTYFENISAGFHESAAYGCNVSVRYVFIIWFRWLTSRYIYIYITIIRWRGLWYIAGLFLLSTQSEQVIMAS